MTTAPHPVPAAFDALVADVRACFRCNGVAHSHVLSNANGRRDARVIFVAEAVGRLGGAVTGIPLTHDESGRRFNAFLQIAGIDRGGVFVTNAVLCNPLDEQGRNRTPGQRAITACRPFLERTIAVIDPQIVVALGRVALESLRAIATPHDADLPGDAGAPVRWDGRTLVPLCHPGRQSTLHRPHAAQVDDWRRFGSWMRGDAGEQRAAGVTAALSTSSPSAPRSSPR